jgi:hypothetical protein
MEQKYRDVPIRSLEESLPKEIHYPLYVHLINGFGYREEWAAPLLKFIQFDSKDRPFFHKSPKTPEAHRHKFLCTLTLSEGSPGEWKIGDRYVRSQDFVDPILEGPLEAWGDDSAFPEPSWTMQFLSAHLDEIGNWKGKDTSLSEVTQRCFVAYFEDFENGDLFIKGKTLFTESGLHLLEAINKLCKRQSQMIVEPATGSKMEKFFLLLKNHLLSRLERSMREIPNIQEILSRLSPSPQPSPVEGEGAKAVRLAISNLLVSGHLLEVCVHPMGALASSWSEEEKPLLQKKMETLASLMEIFFDSKVLVLMNEEQKKAYHFPLFHAYRALSLLP